MKNNEGTIIGDTACPRCHMQGKDKTGNHLILFSTGWGYCNRCEVAFSPKELEENRITHTNAGVPIPREGDTMQETKLPEVPAMNGGLQTPPVSVADWRKWYRFSSEFRSIPPHILDKYEQLVAIDENYFPEAKKYPLYDTDTGNQIAEKLREIQTKKFSVINGSIAGKKVQLLGQKLYPAGGRRILITEGGIDAMSFATVMPDKYRVAICSVPFGANIKAITDNKEYIGSFEEVYVCGDMDEPGQKFVEEIAAVFPQVKHVNLPLKDANMMLTEGRGDELVRAFWNAERYRPPSIVSLDQLDAEDDLTPLEMGQSYPWESMTDMTYGMVDHTIISIGGGPSAGKSSLINAMKAKLMFEDGEVIANFDLESTPAMSRRLMVGYLMGKKIHIPGAVYDVAEARKYADSLRGKMLLYDSRYYNGEWDAIETAIRSMAAEGVKRFFLDPVTALTGMFSASEANDFMNQMMSDLSKLVQDLPITVILVSHLNSPKNGTPHDLGGKCYASQFTGGKGIWRFSHEIYMCERNIHHSDPDLRNTMLVRCGKHRTDGSKMGQVVRLQYDPDTGRLEDKTHLGPVDIEEKKGQQVVQSFTPVPQQKLYSSSGQSPVPELTPQSQVVQQPIPPQEPPKPEPSPVVTPEQVGGDAQGEDKQTDPILKAIGYDGKKHEVMQLIIDCFPSTSSLYNAFFESVHKAESEEHLELLARGILLNKEAVEV